MGDKRIQDRVQFRLRTVDNDLREAIEGMPGERIAELARDGLRLILGIRTTKRLEVAERPINVIERQPGKSETVIRNKPAVFVPGRRE